jgi:hypothetical protein
VRRTCPRCGGAVVDDRTWCDGCHYRIPLVSPVMRRRRPCLRCARAFASESASNRLCPGCRAFQAAASVGALPSFVLESELE